MRGLHAQHTANISRHEPHRTLGDRGAQGASPELIGGSEYSHFVDHRCSPKENAPEWGAELSAEVSGFRFTASVEALTRCRAQLGYLPILSYFIRALWLGHEQE